MTEPDDRRAAAAPDASADAGGDDPPLDAQAVATFLDHLFVRTGLDFRQYSQRSVRRRLHHVMLQDGVASLAELRARLAGAAAAFEFAQRLCVNVTSMFRDPPFWSAFRREVVPLLRPLPHLRAWHAGCATGEEAYSLAIVLAEEGLLQRSRIYATDVDERVLERARAGRYPLELAREYVQNYARAGGTAGLSRYYAASPDGIEMSPAIRKHLVFSRHNLATDASLNEFHVVLCRNVLIYFDAALQERAHQLLWGSLAPGGVLALGQREIVPPHLVEERYEPLDLAQKIYRRRGLR